ncbi:MAG: phosphoribosyl-ATP diphosphatase [Caldilineaceae bacterium SB0662_bin_9]|uniref:Phosphoribosyl-ATP pyrophosphatase n=1 Tax=Caldilineaceae bacterium SB0662_bin_9 TaxID=2605258 RepID=A0A6B1DXJ7_9CHLR|nr:phosphoribosyl-ATP diphosphatase [Caldilineaceae bacterium SB0662_bin_9]
MSDVVRDLERVIRQRQADMPEGSYTTSLFRDGTQRIAQKVGEEGVEVVIAALAQDDGRLASEMADLFYHSLVLLADRGLSWADVEAVFVRRAHG